VRAPVRAGAALLLAAVLALAAAPGAAGADLSRRVAVGSSGWLFLAQDWTVACQDTGSSGWTAGQLGRLREALLAGGRDVVLTVAPDKSTVRSGNVRAAVQRDCGAAARSQLWQALTAQPGFLDLRRPLSAAGARHQTYWKLDSHWSPLGAEVYARALAKRFDPALEAGLTVREAVATRTGDLAQVLGRPAREVLTVRQLVNPGVVVRELPATPVAGLKVPVRRTLATGGRVVPGRTVFVGDSFHDTAVEQLAPLFEEAVFVWAGVGAPSAAAVQQMARADRVVVESVERFAARSPLVSPAAIAAAAALPPRPR
jgi:alginate O-acetyltransferase complex protein AlgJ